MGRARAAMVGGALALALGAAVPSAASASLLLDCADGVVDGDYSRAQLRSAQGEIPADSSEYGECAQALAAALAAGDRGGVKGKAASNGEPGGGDSNAAADVDGDGTVSADERQAANDKRAEVKRDKRELRALASADPVPSLALGEESGEGGGLPTPLLLALIALVAAGAAGGFWYLANRNERFAAALRRLRS